MSRPQAGCCKQPAAFCLQVLMWLPESQWEQPEPSTSDWLSRQGCRQLQRVCPWQGCLIPVMSRRPAQGLGIQLDRAGRQVAAGAADVPGAWLGGENSEMTCGLSMIFGRRSQLPGPPFCWRHVVRGVVAGFGWGAPFWEVDILSAGTPPRGLLSAEVRWGATSTCKACTGACAQCRPGCRELQRKQRAGASWGQHASLLRCLQVACNGASCCSFEPA